MTNINLSSNGGKLERINYVRLRKVSHYTDEFSAWGKGKSNEKAPSSYLPRESTSFSTQDVTSS
jgi:hypothetical protein